MKKIYKKKYLVQIIFIAVAIGAIGCNPSRQSSEVLDLLVAPPPPRCDSSVTISFSSSIRAQNVFTAVYYKLNSASSWIRAGVLGGSFISRNVSLSCNQHYDFVGLIGGIGTNICGVENRILIDDPTERITFTSFSSSACPSNLPEITNMPSTRPLPTTGGRTCRATTCTRTDTGEEYAAYVFGPPLAIGCYGTEAACKNNRYCFNSADNGCDTAGYYTCPDATTCRSTLSGCRTLSACSSE